MQRIYLDHTATTPPDPAVLVAMGPYLSTSFGNASSIHSFGREAKEALERARERAARLLGALPAEIVFTSGGTESDNLAIRGAALAGRTRGRTRIVTSAAEHHAVLDTCRSLADEGFAVEVLPVDGDGCVEASALDRALDARTALVSIMHANNEVGTYSPVRAIADRAHAVGALMHTDAVQSVGALPVQCGDLGVDLLTCSAHKLYGPKGIGILYVRRGAAVAPILYGGGQERGRRPGTENVAAAVGFAHALALSAERRDTEGDRLRRLRDALEERVRSAFPGILINGLRESRLPHILSVSFPSSRWHLEGEMLVPALDLEGIAVSSGSACTSGSIQPSHVLLAMGRDEATARATVRFSFGRGNTEGDVDAAFEALRMVLQGRDGA